MSSGERAGVALVLNKPEWLAQIGDTIPEALTRSGEDWVLAMPRIAHLVLGEIPLGE
jgi:hypothetical protein